MPGKIHSLCCNKGIFATLVIILLYMAILTIFLGENLTTLKTGVPYGVTLLFTSWILFMMFRSNNISRWRNIFFCTYAVVTVISFLWDVLVDGRGHMWLLDQETLAGEAPNCPIISVMDFLPMLFKGTNAFPTSIATSLFGVFAWIIVAGAIFGRGFCSWACLFGGQDSLFASLPRKVRWRVTCLPPVIRYFSFGVLAFIVLHSLATLTPTYCIWLCPFKTTTEFFEINSFLRVIQLYIFFSLWMILVVLLPLMTKKRTQCNFLCPLGAYFSLTNKISPFYIRIDQTRCIKCGKCIESCPSFSLSHESLAYGKTHTTCTRCGACFTACPQQAISYAIKGVSFTVQTHPLPQNRPYSGAMKRIIADLCEPGTIFIFTIFILGTFLFSGSFAQTISILLNLAGVQL